MKQQLQAQENYELCHNVLAGDEKISTLYDDEKQHSFLENFSNGQPTFYLCCIMELVSLSTLFVAGLAAGYAFIHAMLLEGTLALIICALATWIGFWFALQAGKVPTKAVKQKVYYVPTYRRLDTISDGIQQGSNHCATIEQDCRQVVQLIDEMLPTQR